MLIQIKRSCHVRSTHEEQGMEGPTMVTTQLTHNGERTYSWWLFRVVVCTQEPSAHLHRSLSPSSAPQTHRREEVAEFGQVLLWYKEPGPMNTLRHVWVVPEPPVVFYWNVWSWVPAANRQIPHTGREKCCKTCIRCLSGSGLVSSLRDRDILVHHCVCWF